MTIGFLGVAGEKYRGFQINFSIRKIVRRGKTKSLGEEMKFYPKKVRNEIVNLEQAAGALSELSQSRSLKQIIKPLNESLLGQKLLQHKDNDVRLLVAVCFSEIIRVLAPDPPYGDDTLKIRYVFG
ncbi:hypothetical protein ACLOJK_001172 [Asimina triloba]